MNRNRDFLSLTEILINCLIFALAAAVCVSLFAYDISQSKKSNELTMATLTASNVAEAVRFGGSNQEKTAELLNASAENKIYTIHYDKNWQQTDAQNAVYACTADLSASTPQMLRASVCITKDAQTIFSISLTSFLQKEGAL